MPRRATSQIVIPARLQSTRLPRKLLLAETGKPLIQHTYEAASRATRPSSICVAADHDEIANAVRSFGGNVVMTDPNARSGTDRVAEVASSMPDVDIIVNVQGDEPDISAEAIDQTVALLENDDTAIMSTLATPIRSKEKLEDPSCVKVVFDTNGRALYFSRSWIPFARQWNDDLLNESTPHFFQHIGLYAYRRDFLMQIAELPPSNIEHLESLEQLRVLFAGHAIQVGQIDEPAIGIDTPGDYAEFLARERVANANQQRAAA